MDSSINTVRGLVASHWKWDGGTLRLTAPISANASADIDMPQPGQGQSRIDGEGGATFLRNDGRYRLYTVGSATFTFTEAYPSRRSRLLDAATAVAGAAALAVLILFAVAHRRGRVSAAH